MKRQLALLVFILLILTSIFSVNIITMSISIANLPSSSPTIVRNITIPKFLSYIVTTKSSVKNTTVVQTYYINYTVINVTEYSIYVKVVNNATRNTSIIVAANGTYKINLVTMPLLPFYPYIIPYYLYNNTYGIATSNESLLLSFYSSYYNGSIYKFLIHNDYFNALANISSTYGYIVELNETTPLNIFMKLVEAINYTNISIPPDDSLLEEEINLSHPYIYSVYNYSSVAGTALPEGWAELTYPLIIGNYIAQAEYKILFASGQELMQPTSFSVAFAYFIIVIGNQSTIPVTYILNAGNKTIHWDHGVFNLYLSNDTVYVYKNTTSQGLVSYLYVNKDGEIISLKTYNNVTGQLIYGEELISTNYISPTTTYPEINVYENTSLPFKAINPRFALEFTIIIVFVLTFIIIILRREY
ncbi:MAG: hypothetical protein OWQ54_07955 [Sulfolobaceae archaeon]|nr:hypothetical protein [Sulfolobaceae archaeon]